MRAFAIIMSLVLCGMVTACGGGDADDQDSRQPPDQSIGPVHCAASAVNCAASR